jgi:hypothetical protein
MIRRCSGGCAAQVHVCVIFGTDQSYYIVRSEDVKRNVHGGKLSGISANQICIGVATDKKQTVLLVEGVGRTSQKKTLDAFVTHIESGSTLIHDEESAHRSLTKQLALSSVAYKSKDLKIYQIKIIRSIRSTVYMRF